MKVYEGIVHLIGAGTWRSGNTRHTVLEIGDKTLKNISLSDDLSNYIHSGDSVRILVSKGLTSHFVAGIQNNGRKYMWSTGKFLVATIVRIVAFSIFVWIVALLAANIMGNNILAGIILLLCPIYYVYQIKNVIDFIRF